MECLPLHFEPTTLIPKSLFLPKIENKNSTRKNIIKTDSFHFEPNPQIRKKGRETMSVIIVFTADAKAFSQILVDLMFISLQKSLSVLSWCGIIQIVRTVFAACGGEEAPPASAALPRR